MARRANYDDPLELHALVPGTHAAYAREAVSTQLMCRQRQQHHGHAMPTKAKPRRAGSHGGMWLYRALPSWEITLPSNRGVKRAPLAPPSSPLCPGVYVVGLRITSFLVNIV
ncbi:hypothetical protein MRX96_019779 [Rhipicephalus microplus]